MASTAITAKHTITQPSPIAIWQAGEHLDEREVGDPVDARADGGRPASHGGGEDLALDQPARAADADSECGDEEREPTGPLAGCRAAREDNGTLVRRNVVMSVARLNAAPSSHRSSFTESSSDRGLDGAVAPRVVIGGLDGAAGKTVIGAQCQSRRARRCRACLDQVSRPMTGHTKASGFAIDLPHRSRPGADSIRVDPDSMTAASRITSRAALPRFTQPAPVLQTARR
jgi:hypothetical protein